MSNAKTETVKVL